MDNIIFLSFFEDYLSRIQSQKQPKTRSIVSNTIKVCIFIICVVYFPLCTWVAHSTQLYIGWILYGIFLSVLISYVVVLKIGRTKKAEDVKAHLESYYADRISPLNKCIKTRNWDNEGMLNWLSQACIIEERTDPPL